jgi:hypothetical protein
MEIKTTATKKTFDAVKVFREIKKQVAEEVKGMTFEELKKYLRNNSLKLQESPLRT